MPFVFVMAFGLSFSDKEAQQFAQHTVVTLDRKDIMECVVTEDDDQQRKKQKKALGMDEPSPSQMNTEDIEQEYALRSFIECISTSSVSYITSLYLKRD